MKRLVAGAFVPFAILGIAACSNNAGNAPTAAESSWYASGPVSNPPIIPPEVCNQIQATVNNASKAIGLVSANAKGATQQELNLIASDLQSLLPVLPASYQGQINSMISTLQNGGMSAGEKIQGLNEKLSAATGNISSSCKNLQVP